MKKNKGITLIALVITIVVLIILAAVAINLSLGNNGIFNRAKTAKEQYANAESYEQSEVYRTSNTIDHYLVSGARNDTQYDIIFEYNSSVANKKADAAGTYALNLGSGKTSVNDYKFLMVFGQTAVYNDTESSTIVYNFPDEPITKNICGNNCQYSLSEYYGTSNQYMIRFCFTDTSLIIRDITKTGWTGAMIKKIVGVY